MITPGTIASKRRGSGGGGLNPFDVYDVVFDENGYATSGSNVLSWTASKGSAVLIASATPQVTSFQGFAAARSNGGRLQSSTAPTVSLSSNKISWAFGATFPVGAGTDKGFSGWGPKPFPFVIIGSSLRTYNHNGAAYDVLVPDITAWWSLPFFAVLRVEISQPSKLDIYVAGALHSYTSGTANLSSGIDIVGLSQLGYAVSDGNWDTPWGYTAIKSGHPTPTQILQMIDFAVQKYGL